ncbi:hypothetical protein Nm8I071_18440 [Nonomuraea sp. TT08I-71]|nr:hypothetical protein Nm8I071_18440 [Nonomuraea sp. TT08I-71]
MGAEEHRPNPLALSGVRGAADPPGRCGPPGLTIAPHSTPLPSTCNRKRPRGVAFPRAKAHVNGGGAEWRGAARPAGGPLPDIDRLRPAEPALTVRRPSPAERIAVGGDLVGPVVR